MGYRQYVSTEEWSSEAASNANLSGLAVRSDRVVIDGKTVGYTRKSKTKSA